jgi:hypothetical protein
MDETPPEPSCPARLEVATSEAAVAAKNTCFTIKILFDLLQVTQTLLRVKGYPCQSSEHTKSEYYVSITFQNNRLCNAQTIAKMAVSLLLTQKNS